MNKCRIVTKRVDMRDIDGEAVYQGAVVSSYFIFMLCPKYFYSTHEDYLQLIIL